MSSSPSAVPRGSGSTGLVIVTALILMVYRHEFLTAARLAPAPARLRWNRWLLAKSLVVTLGTIAFFFVGQPPAKVAIVAGALLLLTRRIKPERAYREIDWLLLLFAELFIVVHGIETAALSPELMAEAQRLQLGCPAVLAGVSAALSNLVSNVPAVIVLKPFVQGLPDAHRAWLLLAMAATYVGNLTIVGSVANLIVVERARRLGVAIGFWSYFRIGALVTLSTFTLGVLWLG